MQQNLFKYFSSADHAESFLSGKLFFNSLSYFSAYEDNQVRGDTSEGSLIYAPENGLEVNNLTQGISILISNGIFKSKVKYDDIFVFCMSRTFSNKIWQAFHAVVCIEVIDKRNFLSRARLAAEDAGNAAHIGAVRYYPPSSVPKQIWALPEKVCMSKTKAFDWQDEYRIAFGKPEAFALHNVDLSITSVKHDHSVQPIEVPKHTILDLGNIERICKVHR